MDISQLKDYHPAKTGLERLPLELMREGEGRGERPRIPCGREEFLGLLAAVPSLRKVPGVSPLREGDPDVFTALPCCPSEAAAKLCREHLATVAEITGRESLVDFCSREVCCQSHYIDFESFWEGRPLFSTDGMGEKEREHFILFRDFAAQFYPLVGRHGFLAWDISECAGYLRLARACGLIGQEELEELGDYWIGQAQTFRSWDEYAVSLVCGQVYWNFIHQASPQQLREGEELFLTLTRQLLAEETAWASGRWYAPPQEKAFAIPAADIRPLLRDWEGPRACFATDQITVADLGVGYCYREEPETDRFPDSGWRFFSGQETEEYLAQVKNTAIYDLNTIANYDPEILTILTAPYGSAFARGKDGKFYLEE